MRGVYSTSKRKDESTEYAGQARTKSCIEFGFEFSDVSVCMDHRTIRSSLSHVQFEVLKGTEQLGSIFFECTRGKEDIILKTGQKKIFS